MQEWTKSSWEGMEWLVKKGYAEVIPQKVWDKIKCPEQFPECQILKNNILRTSVLIPLSQNSKQMVFIKRHRRRHWKDDFKSLFIPSKAFTEWKTLLHLKRLHLPTPDPLAYGEKRKYGILKDSCLITEEIPAAQPLHLYLSEQLGSSGTKKDSLKTEAALAQLAKKVACLHSKDVYYRDLHSGNILCQQNSLDGLNLFFVDTDKVRFLSKMTPRKRIRDLASLKNSLSFRTESAWVQFLKLYLNEAPAIPFHWEKFFREIDRTARAFRDRHIKSRNKRCLKKTTSFEVKIKRKRKFYFLRKFSEDLIQQMLDRVEKDRNKHAQKRAKPENNGNLDLYRMKFPQADHYPAICVKHYRYKVKQRVKSLISFSPGKLSWFNSNGLVTRKIPTPLPLALVEERARIGIKSSFLITEDISCFERLDEYISEHFAIKNNLKSQFFRKIKFLDSFIVSLHQLYEKKIYFKNLSAKEISVEEIGKESWQFYFENVNRIIFNRRVSPDKQIRNLMQLNMSISGEESWKTRLRFLSHFVRSLPREKRKAFIREVIVKTQGH